MNKRSSRGHPGNLINWQHNSVHLCVANLWTINLRNYYLFRVAVTKEKKLDNSSKGGSDRILAEEYYCFDNYHPGFTIKESIEFFRGGSC